MRFLACVLLGFTLARWAPAPPTAIHAAASECGPNGTDRVRTTLYFGLSRPTGTVPDSEWRSFLHNQVTPRFPQGLTVWEADGQWQRSDGAIDTERAKVLLLVHDGKPKARADLTEIVGLYKRQFQQESVLWESARICAAF